MTDHDRCPECNAQTLKTDIRKIRARNLRAVDNSNEEILNREIGNIKVNLKELKVEMTKIKVENEKLEKLKRQYQILALGLTQ